MASVASLLKEPMKQLRQQVVAAEAVVKEGGALQELVAALDKVAETADDLSGRASAAIDALSGHAESSEPAESGK